MEIGMGQHGEGGGGRQKMGTADNTAKVMLEALLKDLGVQEKEKLMVLVNGTGATTLMELLLVFRQCHKSLAEKNIEVAASLVGEYLTVQEMNGFQLCIARMDDEMIAYWNAPCKTPYYTV
jgi:dihydroxyacetone kinase-like protein